MSIEQDSWQCQVSEGITDSKNSTDEITEEARQGVILARAMIQDVRAMRATGYKDEILVDSELWSVEVKRKEPVSALPSIPLH